MTPFEVISVALIIVTAVCIPIFNYLNFSKQTIIKNDIVNTLSSDTNKIKDSINQNTNNIKALSKEMRYMIRGLEKRIDGIERYLEKINGFVPSSGDTHNERSQD